ncbi:MAG: hypothetical protein ACE37F_31140 [Nannocystaceae bacterium]|nr:hypothetical protein [bacterium]
MNEVDEPAPRRPEEPVPSAVSIAGLVLVASASMPWTPDGLSFFDLLRGEFARGVLEGFLMLVGFGSPFLFGIAIALAPRLLSPPVARQIVRVPIAFMHSQLVLVMIVLTMAGAGVATLPMLGFALVSGVLLAIHTARTHAEGGGPRVGWYARWGGMVVAAIGAWMELQRVGDLSFGWGLHVALAAGVAIVALLARTPLGDAAPEQALGQRPSTLF